MFLAEACLSLFALLYLLPAVLALLLYVRNGGDREWRTADRSSIGHLPPASRHKQALVRIFAAPTVRWRGALASHCWIVFKLADTPSYTRYDYTAWGEPIRMNGFEPDGRWFGHVPDVVFAADGDAATRLVPKIEAAIRGFAFRNRGDYRPWPGPNSNTFVAAVIDSIPEIRTALPPTALGKDFPYDGRWLRRAPSGTGWRLTLGGYAGLTIAWVEGVELNLFGAVAGFDLRRPAVKLPGFGRIGLPGPDGSGTPTLHPAASA